MDSYEILFVLHLSGAIVWIGGGVLLQLLASRAERASDEATLRVILDTGKSLGNTVFIPAALVTLVFGILLVIDGPWSFDQLWIVIGLAGFAATLATGLILSGPRAGLVDRLYAEEGGFGPRASLELRRLLLVARIDYLVLFLVVFDMVVKPTREDVGALVFMAAVLVAGAAYIVWRTRAAAHAPPLRGTA